MKSVLNSIVWFVLAACTVQAADHFASRESSVQSKPSISQVTLPIETPAQLAIERISSSKISIAVTGTPGETYQLLCSPDLQVWASFATVTIPASGTSEVSDSVSRNTSMKYYQALLAE